MTRYRNMLLGLASTFAIMLATAGAADAAVTVTGTVGTAGKIQILTINAVGATTPAVFKFSFVNQTAGTTLTLCAATSAEFEAANCAVLLGQSTGPTDTSLGVADIGQLNGRFIYVLRGSGTAASKFTVQME